MKTKAKPQAPKAKERSVPAHYDFYLSNGDWFAKLTFTNAPQVRRLFKGCRIKGGSVYLTQAEG